MALDKPITHAEFVSRRMLDLFAKMADAAMHGQPCTPEEVRELKDVVNARLIMEQGVQIAMLPYAQFKNAIDAAVMHLESEPPGTLTREDLAQRILLGGWGAHQPNREHKARVSISYSISKTHRLVERGGKIWTPAQIAKLEASD